MLKFLLFLRVLKHLLLSVPKTGFSSQAKTINGISATWKAVTNIQVFCHTLSCEMCHGTYPVFLDIIYVAYLLHINTIHTNTSCWENKCQIFLQCIVYKRQRETLFLEVVYIKAKLMNGPLNNISQFNYGIYPVWRLWFFFPVFLEGKALGGESRLFCQIYFFSWWHLGYFILVNANTKFHQQNTFFECLVLVFLWYRGKKHLILWFK